jgi:hypothetical protein
VEFVGARESTKRDDLLAAPEEGAPRLLASRIPDALVGRFVLERGLVERYDDMTQVPLLSFFLNSSRNASTFS